MSKGSFTPQFVALCECGCGLPTTLAGQDSRGKGARKGEPLRFIRGHQQRGKHSGSWKGGRYQNKDGYIWVRAPGHPKLDHRGYIQEHRLVMEQKLGRLLCSEEIVHHIDLNKANNHPDNLALMNRSSHAAHHGRKDGWARKFDSCVKCGTTAIPHMGKGLCNRCYAHRNVSLSG